jgi:hypothetical protein
MVALALVVCSTSFAQDRFIDCRKFDASVKITIDGVGTDWPLSSYGSPATIDANGELTTGDHFVLADTALYDPQDFDPPNLYEGPEDFDAKTYIAWDNSAFYVLNIARDNQIGFEHARANTIDADGYLTGQSTGWTNDGIEFWFDNDNDRLPAHLDEQPEGNSVNDLQFNVIIDDALQRRDFPNIPEEDIGLTPNFTYQYKEVFRSGADYNDGGDVEFETLSKIDTVTKLDADNMGYTMEIRIPFQVFVMFEPTHPIGFDVSWLDWDHGAFGHFSWNGYPSEEPAYYQEMRFTSDRPLGGAPVSTWELY